jgi:hypothetical protein
VGRDSSVGIANGYRLDGPGIEYQWGRDFPHPSRPATGGPPSLLYNGYRVFTGGVNRPGRGADHPPANNAEVKKEYRYTFTRIWTFMACYRVTFTFTLLYFPLRAEVAHSV